MLTLKKVLESNLLTNLLSTALIFFLAGFFWLDLANFVSEGENSQLIRIFVALIGLVSIYLIWTQSFPTLPTLYLVFTGCYFLYQLLFSYSWPIHLIMGILFVILWLVFPIFHIANNHGIYFFLFVLTLFEVFLTLSFWLVNPITRSLVLAITAYLFGGWLIAIQTKKYDELKRYILFAFVSFVIILATSRWGI